MARFTSGSAALALFRHLQGLPNRRPAIRPAGDKTISDERIDGGTHRTPMDPQVSGQRSFRGKMLAKTVHARPYSFGKDSGNTLCDAQSGGRFRRVDNFRRIRGHAV